ncbi:MAG: hypothetical protein ABJL35_00045 [Parasphingorhabdus sp.]|uniref:hypothetical protein n=1 Tax=Parasphingorhabdus sp. TaxID=2709688 RepID=UPI003299E009
MPTAAAGVASFCCDFVVVLHETGPTQGGVSELSDPDGPRAEIILRREVMAGVIGAAADGSTDRARTRASNLEHIGSHALIG